VSCKANTALTIGHVREERLSIVYVLWQK